MELLLDHSAKVNFEKPTGSTSVTLIFLGGETAIIQLLLDRWARINAKNRDGDTLLMRIIREYGGEEEMLLLLDRGAKVNANNKKGITPLMEAIKAGNTTLVRLILEHGAEVDPNRTLYWLLEWAGGYPIVPTLELLLKHGAHAN